MKNETTDDNDKKIWQEILGEVRREVEAEPLLAEFLQVSVLDHATLESSVAHILSDHLACIALGPAEIRSLLGEAFDSDAGIASAMRRDLSAVSQRDPACDSLSAALLHLKGFHALQAHRAAHWLWRRGRRGLARLMQSRISQQLGVDIHPAAIIGSGIMLDHATGIVIGETAVVDDDVSILHGVTLGGTGKRGGDRHPKVRAGVMIGAGAKILGNVVIGAGAKVAAGSVVLKDVPPHSTVAGVPARVIGRPRADKPALEMDQSLPNDSDQQRQNLRENSDEYKHYGNDGVGL